MHLRDGRKDNRENGGDPSLAGDPSRAKFLETLVFNGQFVSPLVSISGVDVGGGEERRAEADP